MTDAAITEDQILGGRVLLRQPRDGLRAAIDPVLLAAAVPAKPRERVLELGSGSGVAALCLAARLPGVSVTAIDVQANLVSLAAENIVLNGFGDHIVARCVDIGHWPADLENGSFDHVMANPPYLPQGTGTLPPISGKALAAAEGDLNLRDWLALACRMTRRLGTITVVQRADRLDALLSGLGEGVGEIVVFPLWPASGKAAGRVIVRARIGRRTPLRLAAGLVLHGKGGAYTEAASAVLRDAAALEL